MPLLGHHNTVVTREDITNTAKQVSLSAAHRGTFIQCVGAPTPSHLYMQICNRKLILDATEINRICIFYLVLVHPPSSAALDNSPCFPKEKPQRHFNRDNRWR
ncbi:hypothetical protein CHARACLAT_010627 [Characodon lateralis]|uniref:Uncharacterized protein n=1 Tax=Characodon lateralis TaxID=208331 RepID=A0ABU7EIL6_9TELE|nr:hypothetical protein [Characodon lateralis]